MRFSLLLLSLSLSTLLPLSLQYMGSPEDYLTRFRQKYGLPMRPSLYFSRDSLESPEESEHSWGSDPEDLEFIGKEEESSGDEHEEPESEEAIGMKRITVPTSIGLPSIPIPKEEVPDHLKVIKKVRGIFEGMLQSLRSGNGPISLSPSSSASIISPEGDRDRGLSHSIFGLFDTLTNIPKIFAGKEPHSSEHVCVREITRPLAVSEAGVYALNKKCINYKDAYVCIDSKTSPNEEESLETRRIEECCDGFSTNDLQKDGCKLQRRTPSLTSIVDNSTLQKPETEETQPSTYILMPNSKAMILPGVQKDYEWSDNSLLKTIDGQLVRVSHDEEKEDKTTMMNCVPMKEMNVRVKGGVAHIATGPIRGIKKDLMSLLREDGRFTEFISLLSPSTQSLLSNSSASLTVVPFTNAAFQALPPLLQQSIRTKTGCSNDVVSAHILETAPCFFEALNRPLKALDGTTKAIKKNPNSHVISIGETIIKEVDLMAENGIVHVLDGIMGKDQMISWSDSLFSLDPALQKSLLSLIPSNSSRITILVPPKGSVDFNATSPLPYVMDSYIMENAMNHKGFVRSMDGTERFAGNFEVSRPGQKSTSMISCSRFISEAVQVCQATIRFIEKPLPTLSDSILSYLSSHPELSLFTDLYNTVSNSSNCSSSIPSDPFTLFVPVNDGFSINMKRRLEKASEKRLSHFVENHIYSKPLCEDDIIHEDIRVDTVYRQSGGPVRITNREGRAYVGDALVEKTVVLSDGILHIIDSPLPSSPSSKESHSTTTPAPSPPPRFLLSLSEDGEKKFSPPDSMRSLPGMSPLAGLKEMMMGSLMKSFMPQ